SIAKKEERRRSHGRDLVSRRLKPTHVKEILIGTIDELKLGLRFFNFLGLHRGFDHSTASFCVLIHALVQSNLFWPASSLLQTFLLRGLNPSEAFHVLYACYEKCKLGSSSSSSFDLLIQHYVRSRIGLDGVLVFRFMTKVGLLPQALRFGDGGVEETIMLCSQQLKMSPSQKNLLAIWTIKAVVANDLFTDDSFMVSYSFF
ncbi:unnamed protein product, partial [Brassica rapa subsp. narinosa]